jgi:hypothetical protein
VKACISIDMDNYREYRSLVDPDGELVDVSFYDAVPQFLEVLDRVGARATFFMIGRDAEHPAQRRAIHEIAAAGHEVGNHSYTHPYNFRQLARARKLEEIVRCEDAIAEIVGQRPRGFRTPSADVDPETLELLTERGYAYDSSVIPSPLMVWAFMLYGKLFVRHADYNLGLLRTPLAPRSPYLPAPGHLHRARRPSSVSGSQIVEIPFSALPFSRIPFYATLYRMFPTSVLDAAIRMHGRKRPILHMLFHLIDLVDLAGTPLQQALERTPGLSVPLARRRRFIEHAFARLSAVGDAVPLIEVAEEFRSRHGLCA